MSADPRSLIETAQSRRIWTALGLLFPLLMCVRAHASETITYSYDAKGRLIKVVHAGTVNNGIQTTYSHDKADNRKNVKTTGAPS
jgi:YD repeat-containing protein